MTTSPARRALIALVLAPVTALALTGCGGSAGDDNTSPADALAAAKKAMDSASSWHMTLSTKSQPPDGNGVLGADGVGTHDPRAWKGTVEAMLKGLHANVPIVSVGGKVYAKLPFVGKYVAIDPSEYAAPDPADFMDPDTGLSALLTQLKGAKAGKKVRDGKDIVTRYAGTLDGATVKRIIPSASSSGTFDTTVDINADHQVTSVSVTGPFFAGDDAVTYDLTVDDYGQGVKITAP